MTGSTGGVELPPFWRTPSLEQRPILAGLVRIQVPAMRADGSVLATATPIVGFVPPGQTLFDTELILYDEEPANLEFHVIDDQLRPGPPADRYIPFPLTDAARSSDTFNGRVTNPYSAPADIEVVAVVRQEGRIVWGGSALADSVSPGEVRVWSLDPLSNPSPWRRRVPRQRVQPRRLAPTCSLWLSWSAALPVAGTRSGSAA
jgi:hypothetical protein